jgi:hypothetical protein
MTVGQSDGVLLHACVAIALVGCAPVDRGAVELSWRLRPAAGPRMHDPTNPFVGCAPGEPGTGTIAKIRLDWSVGNTTGASEFPCDASTGITGFDLPPGNALISVAPVCVACEAAPGTYVAPPPVQRDVIVGDSIILGAVEIIVEVSSCGTGHPCICESCSTAPMHPPNAPAI